MISYSVTFVIIFLIYFVNRRKLFHFNAHVHFSITDFKKEKNVCHCWPFLWGEVYISFLKGVSNVKIFSGMGKSSGCSSLRFLCNTTLPQIESEGKESLVRLFNYFYLSVCSHCVLLLTWCTVFIKIKKPNLLFHHYIIYFWAK